MTRAHGIHKVLLPLLILGVAGAGAQTRAAEFLCRNGDLTRRVAIGPGDPGQSIACEVRYWRSASSGSAGEVLWRATQDAAYCEARARELLGRLRTGGWTCEAESDPRSSPEPMPEARAVPRSSSPSPPVAAAPEPRSRQAGGPAEAEAGAAPAREPATTGQLAASLAREPEGSSARQPRPPSAGNADAAVLDRVLAQTLNSVQQLYGGEFRAEDKVFGDLDGDGREDAAILVTYEADRDDYVQYLVAYLFDGETYRSSATKNLGGRFLDAQRAEVLGIVDQSIVVVLQVRDGDESCCEARETAFALEEGELVEVEKPAGP
jgi:hypothetical protein